MPSITDLANQFRAAVDRQDAAALGRLARAYSQLYQRMQGKLDSLLLAISGLKTPAQGQVFRLAQYKNLVSALEAELTKYGAFVEVEIQTNASAAIDMALKQTSAYLRAAGHAMPKSLPVNAIYSMLGFLKEGSPLFKRIGELAPYHTQKVVDALLEGISFGYNPAKTAKMFESVMGGGLTDAMRMSRTAQLYATREASRASYVANEDVVEGWVWWSSLDADTCMACSIEHGEEHSNDESMSSHYNCRCTSVPIVKGYNDQYQKGSAWFEGLTDKEQRDRMGGTAFDAWKDGKFDLKDMLTTRHDEVYGEMLATTPLSELINK